MATSPVQLVEECASEFVRSLSPRICVLATEQAQSDVESSGLANTLQDALNLCKNLNISSRTTAGQQKQIPDFEVEFISINKTENTPTPERLESSLREVVGSSTSDQHPHLYKNLVRACCSLSEPAPFETFNHPVACVLAVSANSEKPVEELIKLYEQSFKEFWNRGHDFVNCDFLRCYAIIHSSANETDATAVLQQVSTQFGLNSGLIDVADKSTLSAGVFELVNSSVVPYMERCCAQWNDQVVASRQGFANRLLSVSLSVSKRYQLSPNKLTHNILQTVSQLSQRCVIPVDQPQDLRDQHPKHGYSSETLSYHYSAPEAQLRKIADFAFMLRDYKFAHDVYDMLKKEFSSAKAWAYLASCQEMTILAYLLSTPPASPFKTLVTVVDPLLDSALYTYSSRCHLGVQALRCLFCVSDVLASVFPDPDASLYATYCVERALDQNLLGPHGIATLNEHMSVEMLVCAERKAATRTQGQQPTSRKAAFWLLLAAREWNSLGQTAWAKNCLERGAAISYGDPSKVPWAWENQYLLGRLALELQL